MSDIELRSDALIRLLRTVLEEAHQLLSDAPMDEETARLNETIVRLQQEAERIAPDFPSEIIRYGAANG